MPSSLIISFREHNSSPSKFLKWFWTATTHSTKHKVFWDSDRPLLALLMATAISLNVSGVWLLYSWAWSGHDGYWAFGLALILLCPFIIAHALAFGFWLEKLIWYLLHPKKMCRAIIASILEAQVRELRRRHDFKVVAVAGSVGKTSTKLAVANLLGKSMRVLHQAGNYNDRVTVPLVFFGQKEPRLFNVFAWLRLIGENMASISHHYPYDVVVVELGTDAPGQMQEFAYIKPDITVLTAIWPEHMANFKTMDAVALEELMIFRYSKQVIVSGDDVIGKYLAGREFIDYSLISKDAKYYAERSSRDLRGQDMQIFMPSGSFNVKVKFLGAQGAKFALAAAAVADIMGVTAADIASGLSTLEHFAGRMQILDGMKNSILIDDTYNASPLAVKAALDVLYTHKAPQRIAILGSMNELGEHSHPAHTEVGEYCDPSKLDLLVTIGADAERWLAPAAKRAGCKVHSFSSPYRAGKFVSEHIREGAIVLAKGSQNGVFAEEALKQLLLHPADSEKLVRQSPEWLRTKANQFE